MDVFENKWWWWWWQFYPVMVTPADDQLNTCYYTWISILTNLSGSLSVLDLSGRGGTPPPPSGASQPPKFVLTPEKILKISQKYIADPPSGFPTNRVLLSFSLSLSLPISLFLSLSSFWKSNMLLAILWTNHWAHSKIHVEKTFRAS